MFTFNPTLVKVELDLAGVEEHEAILLAPAEESLNPLLVGYISSVAYPHVSVVEACLLRAITTNNTYDVYFMLYIHMGEQANNMLAAGREVELAVADRIVSFFYYNNITIINISFSYFPFSFFFINIKCI